MPCITTCCWAIWKKEYFNHSILWPQNNLKYDSQSKFSPFSEIGILLKIGLLFCFVRGQILNWALFDFLSMQNNDDLSLKSDSCQKWKVKVWINSYLGLKTESIDIDKEWPNCQPIIWCDFHIFPHISIYLHICYALVVEKLMYRPHSKYSFHLGHIPNSMAVRSQANLKEKQTESEERKAKVDAEQLWAKHLFAAS